MGNCCGKTEAELKEDKERYARVMQRIREEREIERQQQAIRNKEWQEKMEADKQDAYRNWGKNQSDYIYR